MSYDITISAPVGLESFQRGILQKAEEAKTPVQAAMGEKFFEIVRGNFGDVGVDRPFAWAPLSPAYAKRMGREHATLYVTGALEGAIKFETTEDAATVSVSNDDVPYATRHQYGEPSANLPARPYFPIETNGTPLSFTEGEVQAAARAEFQKIVGGNLW